MKKNNTYKVLGVLLIIALLSSCSVSTPEKPNNNTNPKDEVKEPFELTYVILDEMYTLPTSYETLKEDGWVLEDDEDQELASETFIRNKFIRNGPYILDVSFYNPSDEAKPLKESYIASIGAENRSFGHDLASDIVVQGFIDFETSIEDVIDEYDDYTLEESAQFKTYIFNHNKLSKTEIKVNQDDNSIRWIIIESFKNPLNKS